MADEAVIRIVVQDEGSVNENAGPPESATSSSSQSTSYRPPSASPPPAAQAAARPQPPQGRFDPFADASRMREAEVRREQIRGAYERLYGSADKAGKTFDIILATAEKMRGTLGGAFGPIVGSMLDLFAAIRAMRPQDARLEAERRNATLGLPWAMQNPLLTFAGRQLQNPLLAGSPQRRASGGEIAQHPGIPADADEVPIKATAGEFIVRKEEAQKPENKSLLESINSGISKGTATDRERINPLSQKGPLGKHSQQIQEWMMDRYGAKGVAAAGMFGQASTWAATAALLPTMGIGLPPGTGMLAGLAFAEGMHQFKSQETIDREKAQAEQDRQKSEAGTEMLSGLPQFSHYDIGGQVKPPGPEKLRTAEEDRIARARAEQSAVAPKTYADLPEMEQQRGASSQFSPDYLSKDFTMKGVTRFQDVGWLAANQKDDNVTTVESPMGSFYAVNAENKWKYYRDLAEARKVNQKRFGGYHFDEGGEVGGYLQQIPIDENFVPETYVHDPEMQEMIRYSQSQEAQDRRARQDEIMMTQLMEASASSEFDDDDQYGSEFNALRDLTEKHFEGGRLSGQSRGHGKKVLHNFGVRDGKQFAQIDFSEGGSFTNQNPEAQADSFAFARKLKEYAKELKAQGYGFLASGSDGKRDKIYERFLTKLGMERQPNSALYFGEGGEVKLASGGEVPQVRGIAPNEDKVPASLTAGEVVVNKHAAQNPDNKAALDAMNRGSSTSTGGPWSLESTQQQVLASLSGRPSGSGGDVGSPANPMDIIGSQLTGKPKAIFDAFKSTTDMFGGGEKAAKGFFDPKPASSASATKAGSSSVGNAASLASKGGSVAPAIGMAEMASLAAGPAAAVIAGAEIYMQVMDTLQAAAVKPVQALTAFASAMANPDANPAVMVGQIGDATKAVSDKILYVAPHLGILGTVAGEVASSLGQLMNAVNATAERYGEFSPQIAQAQAIAEINHTLGDLRRAQESGPELARYIQMQGELQQKFEDIKIKILMKLLPIITGMGSILEKTMPAAEGIATAIEVLALPLSSLVKIMEFIANLQNDANRQEPPDPTSIIFQQPPIPGVPQPAGTTPGAGVTLPNG